jgi:hypothetical protein
MSSSTISDDSQPESCWPARDKLCRYQCPPGEGWGEGASRGIGGCRIAHGSWKLDVEGGSTLWRSGLPTEAQETSITG